MTFSISCRLIQLIQVSLELAEIEECYIFHPQLPRLQWRCTDVQWGMLLARSVLHGGKVYVRAGITDSLSELFLASVPV